MRSSVSKIALPLVGKGTMSLPVGAKPINITSVGAQVYLWVLAEEKMISQLRSELRHFICVSEGDQIDFDPSILHYIGTTTTNRTIHVFEVMNQSFRTPRWI